MSNGLEWRCWRCATDHHYGGPLDGLAELTCAACGAFNPFDPDDGVLPPHLAMRAGQQALPVIGDDLRDEHVVYREWYRREVAGYGPDEWIG